MISLGNVASAAAVGALVLSAAAVAPTQAGADSGEIEYSCTFIVGGDQFEGSAAASFDTGIPQGLVVNSRENVPLDPGTGTVTLPDGLTNLLRAQGVRAIGNDVYGDMELAVDGTSEMWHPWIRLLDTAVPADGQMSVRVEFGEELFMFNSRQPGTFSIVLNSFYLPLETPEPPGGDLSCVPIGGPAVLDTVRVVATPSPTPTPQRPFEYACTLEIYQYSEDGGHTRYLDAKTTASFDTAIPNGLVVDVGENVPLEPFTGRMTIPESFLDFAGLETLGGSPVYGNGYLDVAKTGERFDTGFTFESTDVPAHGPVSVDLTGWVLRDGVEGAQYQPRRPGTYTFYSGSFGIDLDGGQEPRVWMSCKPVNGPVAIDTLAAVGGTAPSATPIRPVLVQTDYSDDGRGNSHLVILGALALLLAGSIGLLRVLRPRTSRRH